MYQLVLSITRQYSGGGNNSERGFLFVYTQHGRQSLLKSVTKLGGYFSRCTIYSSTRFDPCVVIT